MSTQEHWNKAYSSKPHEGLSWYQTEPTLSLGLIADCMVDPDAAIGDIGGGASLLVDGLLDRGYRNITVLDISDEAVRQAKQRLGASAAKIQWRAENGLVPRAEFIGTTKSERAGDGLLNFAVPYSN